jgi:hypothetical protein
MAARRTSSPLPALLALAVLAIAAAFAPAYVRAAQTLAALQAGDETEIARRVDFEALRADLKGDLGAALDAHYDNAGADARVKSLASMIVAPFVGAIVDRFASPEGLADVARTAIAARNDANDGKNAQPKTFQELLSLSAARGGFASPNIFNVSLGREDRRTVLAFGRTGVLDWRLVGIDLPADLLEPR